MSLIKFATTCLIAATVSQAVGESFSRQAQAQAFGEVPESFPIPGSLPDGTTLRVDGSTSMRLTNEELEGRFEQQYPNVDVELDASRTDEAFEALINGDIDVLSSGRPLTQEERNQGVVEVPLEQREKLAIIVGPENPFEGDLTFEQFAQIFRGDITNWSALGGPDLPIRFVDRPDYSDTRRALSTYTVFEGKPFETGATAAPIDDDETETVINALGEDGIGYSVVSQVLERDDVRIIPMHKTLPDDPRYPYSQYRAFVYKADADPATLAFLGFATSNPGEEVIGAAVDGDTAVADSDTAAADDGTAVATDPEAATADAAGTDAATGTDSAAAPIDTPPTAAPSDADVVAAAGAEAAGRGGFPWWILPLFAIPVLGGLLWWLLKKGGGAAAPAAGAGAATAGVAGAAAAGAAAVGAAGALDKSRLVLTPRDGQNAYAYWEVPQEKLAAVKREGGKDLTLRVYDVTGRPKQGPLPAPVGEYPCIEEHPDLHIPIQADDRSYCAELGYLSADKKWLPIVKSDPVRVPMQLGVDGAAPKGPNLGAMGAGAALAGAAALGAAKLGGKDKAANEAATKTDLELISGHPGELLLASPNGKRLHAQWDIPSESLAAARRQGGETMVAKLYDVTDYQPGADLPEPAAQVECSDQDVDAEFALPAADRNYMAAVGYQTAEGRWLPLAQSEPLQVAQSGIPGAAILGGAVAGVAGAAAMGNKNDQPSGEDVSVPSSSIKLSSQSSQKAYAVWDVPEAAKTAVKAEGGQTYQLRIHDVTDVDINQQSPKSTLTYDLAEADCDRTVPLPNGDSDYLAEVGYQAPGGDWLMLARSNVIKPLQTPDVSTSDETKDGDTGVSATDMAAVGAAMAGGLALSQTDKDQGQTVKVHSRKNALMFDAHQLHHIEHTVASTHYLSPGLYSLKIKDGVFNYDGDDSHPGEPFVILWIHGGTVINPQTGIPVSTTWTTLNGYDDSLTLTVREPATLCAFFVDTYPDDNTGEVTLAITKHEEK
ncbi:MAG: DUF4912 domain-containing protein [Cyanobacteria bacterium P01_D01_bin.156]